jgi:hypothetical protein
MFTRETGRQMGEDPKQDARDRVGSVFGHPVGSRLY